ncbi:hypothetical protein MTBBW1_1820003 [Desulfamplus magnetovallimortis]|uniref:Uncharacterized protein n=1 Tax=Desulfamplus magnetovallimortis TaxID=1246637 RepID=A0A1W1HAF8_9BACT|nr:hypothetical protein MTBBW1_1820003 [Desulfamplus magnetovallimortis]
MVQKKCKPINERCLKPELDYIVSHFCRADLYVCPATAQSHRITSPLSVSTS